MKTEEERKQDILEETKRILECDEVRISQPNKTMYLIIGYMVKPAIGAEFTRNGNTIDGEELEYLREHVIASGDTYYELQDSMLNYCKLQAMGTQEIIEFSTQKHNQRGSKVQCMP